MKIVCNVGNLKSYELTIKLHFNSNNKSALWVNLHLPLLQCIHNIYMCPKFALNYICWYLCNKIYAISPFITAVLMETISKKSVRLAIVVFIITWPKSMRLPWIVQFHFARKLSIINLIPCYTITLIGIWFILLLLKVSVVAVKQTTVLMLLKAKCLGDYSR